MEDPPTSSAAICLSDPSTDEQYTSHPNEGQHADSNALGDHDIEVNADEAINGTPLLTRNRLSSAEPSLHLPAIRHANNKVKAYTGRLGCSRCRFSRNGCSRCRPSAPMTTPPHHHLPISIRQPRPSSRFQATPDVQRNSNMQLQTAAPAIVKLGCSKCRYSVNGCGKCRGQLAVALQQERNSTILNVNILVTATPAEAIIPGVMQSQLPVQEKLPHDSGIRSMPAPAAPAPPVEPPSQQVSIQSGSQQQRQVTYGCSKCRWSARGCGKCRHGAPPPPMFAARPAAAVVAATPTPIITAATTVTIADNDIINNRHVEQPAAADTGDNINENDNTIDDELEISLGNISVDGDFDFDIPPTQPMPHDSDEEMAVDEDDGIAHCDVDNVDDDINNNNNNDDDGAVMTFGCSKCRWSARGCGKCRIKSIAATPMPQPTTIIPTATTTNNNNVDHDTTTALVDDIINTNDNTTTMDDALPELAMDCIQEEERMAQEQPQPQRRKKLGCSKCRWSSRGCGKCREGMPPPDNQAGRKKRGRPSSIAQVETATTATITTATDTVPSVLKSGKKPKLAAFIQQEEEEEEDNNDAVVEKEEEEAVVEEQKVFGCSKCRWSARGCGKCREQQQQNDDAVNEDEEDDDDDVSWNDDEEEDEEQEQQDESDADADDNNNDDNDENEATTHTATFGCSKCRWSLKGCAKCRGEATYIPSSTLPPQSTTATTTQPNETPIPESIPQPVSSFRPLAPRQQQRQRAGGVESTAVTAAGQRNSVVTPTASTLPPPMAYGCSKCRWSAKGCGRCRSEEYRAKMQAVMIKDRQPTAALEEETAAEDVAAVDEMPALPAVPPPPSALDLIHQQREELQRLVEASNDATWWDPLDQRKVAAAKSALHVAAAGPGQLPLCREKEADAIDRWLADRLQQAQGGSLYISGLPGTGKTLTALELVRRCSRHAIIPSSRCPLPPALLSINCMRLTEPRQVVERIIAGYRTACRRSLQNNIPSQTTTTTMNNGNGTNTGMNTNTTAMPLNTNNTTSDASFGFTSSLPEVEDPIIYVPDDEDYVAHRVGALGATDACEALHQIVLQQLPGPESFWKVQQRTKRSMTNNGNINLLGAQGRGMIVVVLDELDGLLSGRHGDSLVGELFALASLPRSRLVLIGVANNIDLVQQLMKPGGTFHRHNLRPAHEIFPSYLRDQIAALLTNRLAKLPGPVIDSNALGLCARKIANGNGDMRRALEAAAQAIDVLVEEEQEKAAAHHDGAGNDENIQPTQQQQHDQLPNTNTTTTTTNTTSASTTKQRVGMRHMAKALGKLTGGVGVTNDNVAALKKLPVPQQLLMAAIGKLLGETLADRGGIEVKAPKGMQGSLFSSSSNTAARFIGGGSGGMNSAQTQNNDSSLFLGPQAAMMPHSSSTATTSTAFRGRKSRDLTLGELQEAHAQLCKRVGVTGYSASEFSTAVDMLVSHGLIELSSGKGGASHGGGGSMFGGGVHGGNVELKRRKVSLRIPEDDVLMAMADVPVLKGVVGA